MKLNALFLIVLLFICILLNNVNTQTYIGCFRDCRSSQYNAGLTGLTITIINEILANPKWTGDLDYNNDGISFSSTMTLELCFDICGTYNFIYAGFNIG